MGDVRLGSDFGITRRGDRPADVAGLLARHNRAHTAAHSKRVADEARRLALREPRPLHHLARRTDRLLRGLSTDRP